MRSQRWKNGFDSRRHYHLSSSRFRVGKFSETFSFELVLSYKSFIVGGMNFAAKLSLVLLGSVVMGETAWATIPDRYQTILDRNAFGLNPPAPVETNTPPPTPPANVKLTGFADTFGQKKAYFMILPKDPKEQI